MNFSKEIHECAKKWNKAKTTTSVINLNTCVGYQKYLALKYEMLCQRMNEFNINK